MKKALKIIGIIAGALALIGIIFGIIFPGVPFYLTHRNSFPNIDVYYTKFTSYNVNFTESTQEFVHGQLTANVPANFVRQEGAVNSRFMIYQCENEKMQFTVGRMPDNDRNFDIERMTGISENQAERWYSSIGREVPQSMFDAVYVWHTISWDDFRFTTSNRAFYSFAYIKNSNWTLENSERFYFYQSEHIKGFIFVRPDSNNPELNQYTAEFFFVRAPNKYFISIVQTDRDEHAWAFFNSIRIENN